MKTFRYIPLFWLILFASCAKTPEIDDATMLDGDRIFDLSLSQPENFLISARYPVPDNEQKNIPVIIAAHGYSATTFEWDELREYADSTRTFLVSQVLLGGHGRSYQDFKESTWKDWQMSIRDEYEKLSDMGYKNIYLAGSSTGCPLIINMVKSGFFDNLTKPNKIFLIDPIVVSSNKSLTLVSALGPVLGFAITEMTNGEQGKWYTYRPYQSLNQLMDLIDLTRKDLQAGITLPEGSGLKTYKSISDGSADPVSAVLIYRGMRNADGSKTEVEMVDSKLHVFTRLSGRDGVTTSDRALQMHVFREMESVMISD